MRLILAILLACPTFALAQTPDRLEWRPGALGTVYQLWREPGRQRTGWTLARDEDNGVWKLHRDGVAIDKTPDLAALQAEGITQAGGH